MTTENAPARRTKRRYAHELFPHPDEGEARPLAVEVPYLLAMACGLDLKGTSAFTDAVTPKELGDRVSRMVAAERLALLADALHRGLAGEEAWAAVPSDPEALGETVWERAAAHGIDIDQIKPYGCGPEPDRHDHLSEPHIRNGITVRTVTFVQGRESDCEECTEPIEPTALAAEEGSDNRG